MDHYTMANKLETMGFEIVMDPDDNEISYVAIPGIEDFSIRVIAKIVGDYEARLEFSQPKRKP